MIKSKHRLKQLFEDTQRLPSSKFNELIDALWYRSGGGTSQKKKADKGNFVKGTHIITYLTPFTGEYCAIAQGTVNGAGVNVIVVDDSDLTKLTIKVPVDCYVRWHAEVINNSQVITPNE